MGGKTVPVVVTLSGKIEVELLEGMTVEDVKNLVVKAWNIDEEQISQPFVVISDIMTNASSVCEYADELSSKVKENGMLRVILPLVQKE